MKKLLVILLAVVMLLGLVACSTAPATTEPAATEPGASTPAATEPAVEGKKHYNFYDIVKIDSDYFMNENLGCQAALKELAAKYDFTYDWHYLGCDNDPEMTMTYLENAIADNADAIFICVPDKAMSGAVKARCDEAGIPVVALDDAMVDDEGKKITNWFGIDAYNIGYSAGEWMANYAKNNNLLDDPEVGLLYMTMDTVSSAVPRTQGQRDAWAAILGDALSDRTYFADFQSTTEQAYDASAAVITGHPEIKKWLILTSAGNAVEGCIPVLEEQGLQDDAVIMSLGADVTVQHWDDGGWDCVTCVAYYSGIIIGQTAVTAVVEHLVNGKEIPAEYACPAIMIDKSNYKEHYIYAEDLDV